MLVVNTTLIGFLHAEKNMEAAAVPPKPTVDLSTLAIYRALMDHNYSTITPSALIEGKLLSSIMFLNVCAIGNILRISHLMWSFKA